MFEYALLPEKLVTYKDAFNTVKNIEALPIISTEHPTDENDLNSKRESGLLSTLTQLLSLSATDEDLDTQQTSLYSSFAKECIALCQLDGLAELTR